jgi:hypothetical protein
MSQLNSIKSKKEQSNGKSEVRHKKKKKRKYKCQRKIIVHPQLHTDVPKPLTKRQSLTRQALISKLLSKRKKDSVRS